MNEIAKALRELYFWQYSNTGCFNNMLFDLIAKADVHNKVKLSKAFPEYIMAYTLWHDSEDPKKFFEDIKNNMVNKRVLEDETD